MLEPSAVRRIDKGGAVEHLKSIPEQILQGTKLGSNLGPIGIGRRSVIVGMGGSGIAGAILSSWLAVERGIPVGSVNDSRIPPWIGEGDLVIAVSYSGNTLETLAATREATTRGADLVGIASGGTVRDLCHGRGLPFVQVPTGMMPRSAFGYMFGALAALFAADSETRAAAGFLQDRGRRLLPTVAVQKNPAKKLAVRLNGRTPIVYATPTYAPVARRWQAEFNENAKVLAWASVLPEADHNELVGWAEDPAAKRFAPILLRDPAEAEDHAAMIDATRELVKGQTRIEEVVADGPSLLARMLTTVQLGDWTSFYLAILRKVDPTPVAVIQKLKARLARK